MRLIDADEAKKEIKRMQTLKPPEKNLLTLALDRTPTYEPPNDPLTLEELREMDGEPVWVVQPGYKSSYGLVRTTWTVTMLVFNGGKFVAAEFAILENGCKIYRRKQEEGTP